MLRRSSTDPAHGTLTPPAHFDLHSVPEPGKPGAKRTTRKAMHAGVCQVAVVARPGAGPDPARLRGAARVLSAATAAPTRRRAERAARAGPPPTKAAGRRGPGCEPAPG